MVSNAMDQNGTRVTLAEDGGIWVGDSFWPTGNRIMAKAAIVFPLVPDPETDCGNQAFEDIPAIMEALRPGGAANA